MASGDCGTHDDLLQVGSLLGVWSVADVASFLIKDAQDDIAGRRLKA